MISFGQYELHREASGKFTGSDSSRLWEESLVNPLMFGDGLYLWQTSSKSWLSYFTSQLSQEFHSIKKRGKTNKYILQVIQCTRVKSCIARFCGLHMKFPDGELPASRSHSTNRPALHSAPCWLRQRSKAWTRRPAQARPASGPLLHRTYSQHPGGTLLPGPVLSASGRPAGRGGRRRAAAVR